MRSILCKDCASKFNMHPEDQREGWRMRKVEIPVKVPTDGSHRIQVMAGNEMVSDIPVPIIVCDHCNDQIQDGTIGIAVTMWQGEEPENWEKAYTR